jgi:hypothetical protein
MAIASGMLTYARRAGLEALPCYPDHGPEEVKACPAAFDQWPAELAAAIAEPEAQTSARTEAEQRDWQESFDLKTRIHDLAASGVLVDAPAGAAATGAAQFPSSLVMRSAIPSRSPSFNSAESSASKFFTLSILLPPVVGLGTAYVIP